MRLFELQNSYIGPMVYHGTDKQNVTILKPNHSSLVGDSVVFAATIFDVAIAMAGHWTDEDFDFGRKGQISDGFIIPYILEELKEGGFDQFFRSPITVYLLPSLKFQKHNSLQDFELVSFEEVKTIGKVEITNPIEFLEHSPFIQIKRFSDSL